MRALRIVAAISAVLFNAFIFQACDSSSDPEPEQLARFDITAPDTVTAGIPFDVTVTAIGDQGSSPFTGFSGAVELSLSTGILSPPSLELTRGEGSVEAVMSVGGGSQVLTAAAGGRTGTKVLNADVLAAIPGDPADPVAGAIPGFAFYPRSEYYSSGHPDLGDKEISHNIVIAAFELGTTIGEANSLIADLGASIVGGLTGVNGQAPGIIFLRLPASSHPEMSSAIAALNEDPTVAVAVQDIIFEGDEIPADNIGNTGAWSWQAEPSGGNWGLERCRVPQMWNLNGAVRKSGRAVMTGIVDAGFDYTHEDVIYYNMRPGIFHTHGMLTAGIIAATYDNDRGIDGVNPFSGLTVIGLTPSGSTSIAGLGSVGQAIVSDLYDLCRTHTQIRVVNMSLGYNWAQHGIDGTNNSTAKTVAYSQGLLMKYTLGVLGFHRPVPLICVSAGNDSNNGFGAQDARYNSPMANAALEHGVESIIVVEALENAPGTAEGNATLAAYSCINGQISAPGSSVQSADLTNDYLTASGTSLASPFVAGLAGYLMCVDPGLTHADIRNLLMANSLSVGGGGSPRVDAWASVVDIDRLRGNTDILKMMCDIDDGTEDGNRRIDLATGAEVRDEDFDGDGGIGDGKVDMSDFRRWRDWLAQVDGNEPDGAEDHPKKDVNGDGEVGTGDEENLYPRGDFNGDGRLHATAGAYVPGAVLEDATDLEVFKMVFDDPEYEAVDLDELVHSCDIEIDATRFFGSAAPSPVLTSRIRDAGTGEVLNDHDFTSGEPKHLLTVPYVSSGYNITLELSTTYDEQEYGDAVFRYDVGADVLIEVIASMQLDPKATYLHICEDVDIAPRIILLSSLGIEPGDVLLLESSGHIDQGGGWTGDNIAAVFSSSSSLLPGTALHRVPGAIDAGQPYVTDPTWNCGGEPTDIPEDFTVNDTVVITVPAGARYLFVAKRDTQYQDNSDPTGQWRFVIARIHGNFAAGD